LNRPLRIAFALLALLALFVCADNMGRPLANPDEGRYSEISREMALSGDWVTPRLNGLKYFEKPPLQYWASAAAFKVLGVNEFAARVYTALCALLTLACVGYAARRLASAEAALLAVAVLLSSPYFMALGCIVTLDMGLTAWTTLSVCAFLVAQAEAPNGAACRRWMLVAWVGMALAVLSKGLIGIVFPAAAIFMHCLIHRDWRMLARLEWLRGSAIFIAIVAPWFVLVSRANPEFAQFFFVHEHFERFVSTGHRREGSWWYFWPILFAGFLPWMLALVPAAWSAWRRDPAPGAFPWRRFAILWTLLIVLFFSASSSKLPAYILPVFPILALVLGEWLARASPRGLWPWVAPVALFVVALAIAAWGAPERARDQWTRGLYLDMRPWVIAGTTILAAAIGAGGALLYKGRKWAAIATVVAAALVFIQLLVGGYERLSPRQSGKIVAERLNPFLTPATRVYSVRLYDQSFPFYIGRTVTLVDYVDEFALGQRSEPGKWIATLEAFEADWVREGEAVAIIQPGLHEILVAHGLPVTLVYRDERRALVKKP
jgi:4-amino-4-deoxy-L-arabinose transferase-like glycosyltransferase